MHDCRGDGVRRSGGSYKPKECFLQQIRLSVGHFMRKVAEKVDTNSQYFPDVTKTTRANRTALHFAVERWNNNADQDMQRLCCIQQLISLGVPLDTRDCNGMTALHLAALATRGQAPISDSKVLAALQMKKSNVVITISIIR
ncbi:unnamed protein product [Gongylonema pulchrum]|uniref:ANK_REP_REGION domain-containing protein n=1 Tax=Gongylonema pulchrum TaxID=637853 RepID=A0A183ENH4_9BILA|nr:unnamed protein product [Gongylonema pulchrum]